MRQERCWRPYSCSTKAHDLMLSALVPLFLTAGHTVRTHCGMALRQRRGDVEIRNYQRDQAASRSLVSDLSITHDSYGPLQTGPRSITMGNNTLTIRTFRCSLPLRAHPPACTANFGVFFFYRPTGKPRRTSLPLACHRNATNRTSFHFKRIAFFHSLKSKVGLAPANTAAYRINLNVEGCVIVAARARSFTRSPSSPPPSFTQSPFPPRSLMREGQTNPHRSRLVVSRSACPPLLRGTHADRCVREVNTQTTPVAKHGQLRVEGGRGPARAASES